MRTAEPALYPPDFNDSGNSRIKLLLSPEVDCPVCFGLLRPVILMPKRMYDDVGPEDLRMILRHELAHIERRDCWVNLFQRLVEAVLFFHPLVWYASFQLTQHREELCDRHVIAGGASAENYAELLGRIARRGFEKKMLHAVALFEGRLLSRVQSLLGFTGTVQIRISRKAMGMLAVAAMLCLAVGTVRLEARSDAAIASDIPAGNQGTTSFRAQEESLGPDGNRPVGSCSLSGRVVSIVTGDPIIDATMQLYNPDTRDSIFIKVAGDGSFSFDDIPSGQYYLSTPGMAGFQSAAYDPDAQGNFVFSLVEGEERSGIVFRLEPDFFISGKILGEDGKPVTDGGFLVKAVNPRSAQYVTETMGDVANDGSYHLIGLSGDPVLVMVSASPIDHGDKDRTFPSHYYPDTVSRDQARPVDFSGTTSRENIDIHLSGNDSVVLEGIVSDEETGTPVADAMVAVNHSEMLSDYVSTHTDKKGFFRMENVGAGEFLVHIDARTSGYVRSRYPLSGAAGDTVRLNAGLKTGASISGIVIDGNGEPVDVSKNAWGFANMIDPTAGEEMVERASHTWRRRTNGTDGARPKTLISFSDGKGDYLTEYMVFPTDDSFFIKAVMPGETHLTFHPEEQGMEVKQILYNGEDVMTVKELPEGEMDLASAEAVLETHPRENIEGVAIVLGPAEDASPP